ncbi:MAG TPA: hypothetical protein VE944_14025 [Nostoc sp.]|uniref:hypothetical protein n=1 Tax=Nostoc sp. TaxID=1180 RepID=UPI002D72F999|nr:hypothetical protein [Nostoc sp.]HYX15456.1 hypothetical protein [Nostoc sp.]
MHYRLALTSGLILASFVSITPVALAEVTFNNLTSGVLEPVGGDDKVLESVNPTTLAVSIPYNTVANITVLPLSLVFGASNDPNGTKRLAIVNFGSTSLRSDVSNNTATLAPGETNLEVRLRVERPVAFIAGTYNYAVNLNVTITPP